MSITNPTDPYFVPASSTPPLGPLLPEEPTTIPLLSDESTITDSAAPSEGLSSPTATPSFLASDIVVLSPPEITLNQFFKTVTGALNTLRDTVFDTENQNNATLRNMHINGLLVARNLSSLFSNLIKVSDFQAHLFDTQTAQVNAINSAIQNYNMNMTLTQPSPGSDTHATNAINNAIAQFNAGTMTIEDFTAAVTAYNDYASARNLTISPFVDALNSAIADYNAQAIAVNQQIDEVNALRAGIGLPPIPHEELLNNATTLPLVSLPPTIPVPSLPPRNPISLFPNPTTPPTQHDLVSLFFTPQFEAEIPSSISFQNFLELVVTYREFVQDFIESRVKVQPNGYIEPLPSVFFNSSAGVSTGAGVGFGGIAVGLDTRGLEKILGNAIYASATAEFGLPLPARLAGTLKIYTQKTLATSALFATIPAMRLVANKLPFINIDKSASDVFLGLTYSNHISNLVASDDHLLAIQGFVREEFPGLDHSRLEQLSSALTAGLNISLLQFGLYQLSQSLGISGLSAQLVANVAGLPVQDIITKLTGGTTVQDTLQNPLSVASLKADLANQVAVSDVSQTANANSIVNSVVNHALQQQEIGSEQELQASLLQQFQNHGISNQNAVNLAQRAADFISAEKLGLYLLDTQLDHDLLSRQILTSRLTQEGINAAVADRAISKILSSQSNNLRSLRDKIADELASQNVSGGNALLAATKVVVGDLNINAFSLLSPSELSDQIASKVVSLLSPTLGSFDAQNIANQLTIGLFGPTTGSEVAKDETRRPLSIKNQLIAQLETLHERHDENINAAIQEAFREFSKPNFDLYTFNRRLMDPANAFFMLTGTMYKGMGDFPSNYQNTIDVII